MIQQIKLRQSVRPIDWAKVIILLSMSFYLFVLIISGKLQNYINLRFEWLSYVGATIFLVLGCWQFYSLLRRQAGMHHEHDDHDHHHHEHDHHHHEHGVPLSWAAIVVVALPLIFATFLPSQPLGADAITGTIRLDAVGGLGVTARYDLPPAERNVLDWLRAFEIADTPAELNDLPVDVIAFVYRDPNMAENEFMAARFTLSCCVADAFAVGMPVHYAEATTLEDGAWVHIRGTLQAGTFRNETVPIIIPETIEPADAPENPYLYS